MFNFNIENIFLQFITLILILLLISTNNLYYNILYLFLTILFLGSVLCLINNELTAGFLWVGELIVIFILLLLVLYVNVNGDFKKTTTKLNMFLLPIFIVFSLFFEHDNTFMEDTLLFLYCDLYWVDYYEALNDYNNNDLYGFYVSYYILNNIVLMIIGLILFYGSIICVLLFRSIKVVRFNNMGGFFEAYEYSQNFLFSIFMRKQDMFDQNGAFASIKTIFKQND